MSQEIESSSRMLDHDANDAIDVEQIVNVLKGRAAFYDLLASLYFRPLTVEQIDAIAQMDLSDYADLNEEFAEGLNDMTRYLRRRHTGTRQELAVDFTAAFAGTSSYQGRYAVPYESVFTSEEGLMFQESYHEVYQFFRQHRVERAEGYDYPDDHLSFMCEFLAILSQRTIDALEAGSLDDAIRQMGISRAFLDDHILSWFDELRDLAMLILKTRFYLGVLKVTRGFFHADRQIIEDVIEAIEDLQFQK